MAHTPFTRRYVRLPEPVTSLAGLQARGIQHLETLRALERQQGFSYPLLTNGYYAGLIDKDDPADPLRRLVIPQEQEILAYVQGVSTDTGSFDTSGEAHNQKAPGLQHKYKPTALALISNACASLCRECFRKRLFIKGQQSKEELFPNDQAMAYLKQHREINTILLSGGDTLMLTNDSIRELLGLLADPELDHIHTIRFGSKIHAFYPQRIDEELCTILEQFQQKTGKTVHVCTHFEHLHEITPATRESFRLMRAHGIELYNQTVLLRGVNDDPYVLYQLFEQLAKEGVRPYYLFQCRPVIGTYHFRVPLKQGIAIVHELMQLMTGVHKPRYAMSTPLGKMEILGVHPQNTDEVLLKLHSSKAADATGSIIAYNVAENNPYWYEQAEIVSVSEDGMPEGITED